MKLKTKIPFLVTANQEPNIGVIVFPLDEQREAVVNQGILKRMLEEHFDTEIAIIRVEEFSRNPYTMRATVTDVPQDKENPDQQWAVELNETWIYE